MSFSQCSVLGGMAPCGGGLSALLKQRTHSCHFSLVYNKVYYGKKEIVRDTRVDPGAALMTVGSLVVMAVNGLRGQAAVLCLPGFMLRTSGQSITTLTTDK